LRCAEFFLFKWSYTETAAKTAPARAVVTRAILESMICVDSKMALVTKSHEVSSNKMRESPTPAAIGFLKDKF
jgi:hypothetical protein